MATIGGVTVPIFQPPPPPPPTDTGDGTGDGSGTEGTGSTGTGDTGTGGTGTGDSGGTGSGGTGTVKTDTGETGGSTATGGTGGSNAGDTTSGSASGSPTSTSSSTNNGTRAPAYTLDFSRSEEGPVEFTVDGVISQKERLDLAFARVLNAALARRYADATRLELISDGLLNRLKAESEADTALARDVATLRESESSRDGRSFDRTT